MIINYYDTSLVKACEQRLIVQMLEVELLKIYDHVIVQLPAYSIQGETLTVQVQPCVSSIKLFFVRYSFQ